MWTVAAPHLQEKAAAIDQAMRSEYSLGAASPHRQRNGYALHEPAQGEPLQNGAALPPADVQPSLPADSQAGVVPLERHQEPAADLPGGLIPPQIGGPEDAAAVLLQPQEGFQGEAAAQEVEALQPPCPEPAAPAGAAHPQHPPLEAADPAAVANEGSPSSASPEDQDGSGRRVRRKSQKYLDAVSAGLVKGSSASGSLDLPTTVHVKLEAGGSTAQEGQQAKRRKLAGRAGSIPRASSAKPAGAATSSLQHILELLVDNKEPFNNNEWRREPWPARPYVTIPEYQVAADCGEEEDRIHLLEKIRVSAAGQGEAAQLGAATSQAIPAGAIPAGESNGIAGQDGGAAPGGEDQEEVRAFVSRRFEEHARSLELAALPPALQMGVDVEERPAWGLDCYTYKAIVDALLSCPEVVKAPAEEDDGLAGVCNTFIRESLLPAINRLGKNGWNICLALRQVEESEEESPLAKAAAQFLLWALPRIEGHCKSGVPPKGKPVSGNTTIPPSSFRYWRVHPKGQGIFAARDIPKGTFVHEYLGELYSPWRWFEKQDWLRKNNPNQALPDFYNISLERPKEVPGGADVIFVEAADCGNFASRLSHSCGPNCRNVATTVGGARITNALFTTRDIAAGEELCWDYACVTESEKEFRAAVCLCGTPTCRGSFLYFANSSTFQMVMQKRHDFLDRNAILVRACSQALEEADLARLSKHGIGSSVLGPQPPTWLTKWAALILEYVELERSLLPDALLETGRYSPEAVEHEAEGVKENRLQNLAITIDKINLFLRHQPEASQREAPLMVLGEEEVLAALWSGPDSVQTRARKAILTHFREATRFKGATISPEEATEHIELICQEVAADPEEARRKLGRISQVLRGCGEASTPMADTLLLISRTRTYFTSAKFDNIRADVVKGSSATGTKAAAKGQAGKGAKPGKKVADNKSYRSAFLWAQCTAWFKQTVYDPTASLSAERRGAISLPDTEKTYTAGKGKGDTYKSKQRGLLLKTLARNPSAMWPVSLPFSFTNPCKLYGSVMLDAALNASQNGTSSQLLAATDANLAAALKDLAAFA